MNGKIRSEKHYYVYCACKNCERLGTNDWAVEQEAYDQYKNNKDLKGPIAITANTKAKFEGELRREGWHLSNGLWFCSTTCMEEWKKERGL